MRTSAAIHNYSEPDPAPVNIFAGMELFSGMELFTGKELFTGMEPRAAGETTEKLITDLRRIEFDRVSLACIGSSAMEIIHHKQHISQMDNAWYLIKFQLVGQCIVEQRGRRSLLYPGDFAICATHEPYRLQFPQRFHQAVLMVPQALLRELFTLPGNFLGLRMAKDSPTNGLLSEFIGSLAERMDRLEPDVLRRLETNLLDLLILCLRSCANRSEQRQQCSAVELHLARIKQLIAMHLRNSKLSPDFIAMIAGISTRYLHMLFKSEGISLSRYIQQQRLAACHRTLLCADQHHRPIIDIALEWGFGDISHFHRCFKSQYGVTPRQLRLQGTDA